MTILPSAIRGHGYRREAIDLQPGGSTITVTVPSDNPYEMGDDVEIVTQMSGGMAGPDPKMRSKRIAAKGMRQMRPAQRIHAGFLPGMGDGDDLEGDEVEIGLFGPVRKPRGNPKAQRQARPKQYLVQANPIRAGFLPGMGTDPNDVMDGEGEDLGRFHGGGKGLYLARKFKRFGGRLFGAGAAAIRDPEHSMAGFGAEVAAGKRQKVIPAFRPSPDVLARGKALFAPRFDQVAGFGAVDDGIPPLLRRPVEPAPADSKPFDWQGLATGLTSVGKGAADVLVASAQREAAKAERGPKSVTYQTNLPAPERSGSKLPWIVTGVGALVAVGVLAFVLTRKKA